MSHRTRTWALSAATALAVLSGCSQDEPGVAEATPAPADEAPASAPVDDTAQTTAPVDDTGQTAAPPADDAEQTSAPVQAGPLTSRDGAFTVDLPEGWNDASAEAGEGALVALRENERTDDFFTNLVVVTEEPIPDLEAAVEGAGEALAGDDGEYELLEPIEIDGETAYGYLLTRTVSDVDIVQIQRYVEREEVLYVLTMSAAQSRQQNAEARFAELRDSWAWQ